MIMAIEILNLLVIKCYFISLDDNEPFYIFFQNINMYVYVFYMMSVYLFSLFTDIIVMVIFEMLRTLEINLNCGPNKQI